MFSNFGGNAPTFGGGTFPNSNTTASVFGQPQQPAASTSLFGGGFNQAKPTFGSSFGSPQNQGSMFGQQNRLPVPSTGGIFSGQTATVSPFSATGQIGQTQIAGTSVPFNAITGTDTMMKNGSPSPISTRHQCITCMKEYENKSLEELRLEDYQLNRKGSAQGLFMSPAQPQQNTGLFSSIGASAAATPFGQTTTFGSNPSGGGLFSSLSQPKPTTTFFTNPATSTPAFGANTAFSFSNPASQATSVFGTINNAVSTGGGLGANSFSFVQPQSQTTGGLFSQKPQNTATTTAFGGFGTTAFTNTTPASKPLGFGFGSGTTPTFGAAPAPGFSTTPGGLFGSQAQPQQTKPFSFASPFSSQAQPTQSAFGAPASSAFTFTTTTSAPSVNFGTGSNTFGSLGGGTTNSFAPLSFGGAQQPSLGFGNTFGLNTNTTPGFTGFAPSTNFPQQVPQQQQQPTTGSISFATTPYKDSPLFYNLIANRNLDDMIRPTSPAAQRAIKEASRRRTSTSITVSTPPNKNVTFPTTKTSSFNKSIFDGFEEEDKGISIDILSPKTSVKKLALKSFRNSSAPNRRHTITFSPSARLTQSGFGSDNGLNDSTSSDLNTSRADNVHSLEGISKFKPGDDFAKSSDRENSPQQPSQFIPTQKRYSDADRSLVNQLNGFREKGGCRVINTRAGYYVSPPVEALDKMVDEMGNCFVKGLVIGRQNHGEIRFLDIVNVAGVNLDEIVHFRHKEVVIYPDDNNKPQLGEGLNCPAFVSLERVWPIDKVTKDPIKFPPKLQNMDYEDTLRRACIRLGAEFVSYTPETGIWTFKVQHFSKYDCEAEETEDGAKEEAQSQSTLKTKGLGLGLGPSSNPNEFGYPRKPVSATLPKLSDTYVKDSAATWKPRPMDFDDNEPMPVFRNRTRVQPIPLMDMQSLDRYASGDADVESVPYPNRMHTPPSPVIPFPADESMNRFSIGDIEHNPLTPSESNDSESDVAQHDIREGYESVLKWKTDTSTVQMMKSALMLPDNDDDISMSDFQPPSKRSFRLKDPSSRNIEIKISTQNQKKSSIALRQLKPGPPITSLLPVREHEQSAKDAQSLAPHYVTAVKKKDEIPIKAVSRDLFAKLPMYDVYGPKINTMPRVCFGPMGMFVTVANSAVCSPSVVVKRMNTYASKVVPKKPLYLKVLDEQMTLQLNEGGPLVSHHIDLLWSLYTEAKDEDSYKLTLNQELMMWELCQILWPMEQTDPTELRDIGFTIKQRKDLSSWLKKSCMMLFPEEVGDQEPKTILNLLKKGRRQDACSLAIKKRNYILALCIAQKPMAKSTSSNCEEQLNLWGQEGALEFIESDMLMIYRLCCGKSILDTVDLFDMSTSQWLQHFALHLWYACPPHIAIDKALASYQSLLKTELSSREQMSADELGQVSFPSQEESSIPNLCVQLLKLYSFTGYPLRSLLDPRTNNPDCLDYKLAWLLMTNLEKFGYICDAELFDSIVTSFVGQLEQLGLFQWAIFVMCHLPQTPSSHTYSQRILERNLGPFGSPESEAFLMNQLNVPAETISAAKNLRPSPLH